MTLQVTDNQYGRLSYRQLSFLLSLTLWLLLSLLTEQIHVHVHA